MTEPSDTSSAAGHDDPAEVVRAWLVDNEIEFEETGFGNTGFADDAFGSFSFALPGEKKLQTPVRIDLGPHSLAIHAFVCRRPDEQFERVHRWLLERNMKMYAVAFGIDHHGDIYLDARLPLSSVNPDDLDRLLGSVLTYADSAFNTILELGFETSIRKEWAWRIDRGESTANLEAFRGWLEAEPPANP